MGKTPEVKKIFLDTDVILDLIMEREPHHISSAMIFELAKQKEIMLHTSAVCFTNIFYIFRKIASANKAKTVINSLLLYISILDVNSYIVTSSLNSKFNDFEDAVQYFTAVNGNMNIFITRNISDYVMNDIPVMTPKEFLNTLTK